MEAGPGDLLKVKSTLKGAGKIHMGMAERLWPRPAIVHVCWWCSFLVKLEALSWAQDRVLKRLNQSRQGGRKLFPISLWSQYVSWLTHPPAIRSCIGSPKAPCTPGFQHARCASISETCSLHHLAGECLLIFWVDLTHLWDPQFFVSVLSFLLR